MYVNHNKRTPYTKEMILEKLRTDARWVERALVVLYERQTQWEQRVDQTVNRNDIGFQPADARYFSSFARQVIAKAQRGIPEGERLTPKQLAYARRPWRRPAVPIPAIAKYREQILEIIEAKARA